MGSSWQESLQLVLEIHAGPVKARADGARLKIERLGYLLVREALEVSQDDHDATLLRQLGDGAVKRPLELAGLRRDVGPRALIRHSKEDFLAAADRPAVSRRQPVEAETGDDGVEPSGQLGIAAEFGKAPVRPEKGLLGDFLRFRRAAEHAQRHAEDAVLMGSDELLKGPRVARPQPVEQFRGIGSISFSHV